MENEKGQFVQSPACQQDTSPIPQGAQSWFALGVRPRHEKTVLRLLGDKGYETFLPSYTRRHKYATRVRSFELPLFPGYVFCRLDPVVRLPILTTPGVLQVVGAGRVPVPVNEDEITSIRRAVEARVPLTPMPYFHAGQRVRVTSGPLAGVEGSIMSAREPVRLVLSMTLLQRSVLVEIDADCVSLA